MTTPAIRYRISGSPFHQHLFDFTPLSNQELLFKARVHLGKQYDSLPNHCQKGRSSSRGDMDVRGRPVQQKFGRTGSKLVVALKGISPRWFWIFGSAPSSRRSSIKSRLVTLPQSHALCKGVLPCGIAIALMLAPCCFADFRG